MENINKKIMESVGANFEIISWALKTDIYENIKIPTFSIIESGIREGFEGHFRNDYRRVIKENIQNGKYK